MGFRPRCLTADLTHAKLRAAERKAWLRNGLPGSIVTFERRLGRETF
jgi:hypothetical protein